MNCEFIIRKLESIFDPLTSNETRSESIRVTEQYKAHEFQLDHLERFCADPHKPLNIMFGLRCLEYKVKHSWGYIEEIQKQQIKQCLSVFVSNFPKLNCSNSEENAICLIITQIFVHLIKCEWPQQWPTMISEFVFLSKSGAYQSVIVFETLLRLSEDILFFQDVPLNRRRELCSSLSNDVDVIINTSLESIHQILMENNFSVAPISLESTATIRSACRLLCGLLEWCEIRAFLIWKAIKPMSSSFNTVPSLQIILSLLNSQSLRLDAVEVLLVILSKKPIPVPGIKHNEHQTVFKNFISISNNQNSETVSFLFEVTSSICLENENQSPIFFRKWGEVMVALGHQIVENWSTTPTRDSITQNISMDSFDIFLQAIIMLFSHPSRLVSSQCVKLFSCILESPHPELIAFFAKHLNQLLKVWKQQTYLIPYPQMDEPFSSWIQSQLDKSDFHSLLTQLRNDIRSRCFSLAIQIWPSQLTNFLLDWLSTLLAAKFESADYVHPSMSFIKPYSNLAMEWEALDFVTDKLFLKLQPVLQDVKHQFLLACSASIEELTSATNLISIYIDSKRQLFSPKALLPSDPIIRQHYLNTFLHFVCPISASNDEIILLLLQQHFQSLRYNPTVPKDCSSQLAQNCSLGRSSAVKNLHLTLVNNIFQIARTNCNQILPLFDSFCLELNDVWSNQPCGLLEQCILLETVVYLALHLPCPLDEQKTKLSSVLSNILNEWTRCDGLITNLLNECSGNGLLRHFGFDQDSQIINSNAEFVNSRNELRFSLQRIVFATIAILRRLRRPVSMEQSVSVCIPLIEPVMLSIFQLVKLFNEIWLPESVQSVHESFKHLLEVPEKEKLSITGLNAQNKKSLDNSEVNTFDFELNPLELTYCARMQVFFYSFTDQIMMLVQLIIEGSAARFYTLPTEKLSMLLFNFVLLDLDKLSEYKLLCIFRRIIAPFVRHCPIENLPTAVIPIMPFLLDSIYQKVNRSWGNIVVVDKTEIAEDETSEEVFWEETVRSLSCLLVDLTCQMLSTTSFKSGTNTTTQSDEVMDNCELSSAPEAPSSLGTVASMFFMLESETNTNEDVIVFSGNSPLARIISWFTTAITWSDSRICHKAAIMILQIIDFVVKKKDVPARFQNQLSAELGSRILIGVLYGLHTNGKFWNDCCIPLLTCIIKVFKATDIAVIKEHLEPIIVTALTNCQQQTTENAHAVSVQEFVNKLFHSKTTLSDRVLKDNLKNILQPIIGIPVSEKFRDSFSLTVLNPLERPKSLRNFKKLTAEVRSELAIMALTDLFASN